MAAETLFDLYLSGTVSAEGFEAASAGVSDGDAFPVLGFSPWELAAYRQAGQSYLEERRKYILRQEIIEKAKHFFREEIALSHRQNTEKLKDISQFNLNPFLDKYKANFLTGDNSPRSIAKALVYPRMLGTSINTTFGTKLQKFCSTILEGYASTTTGIDIEFVDLLDGRRKYCQIKAGPNTINKDDVETIDGHFNAIKHLARTNNLTIGFNDLVVGVFYGKQDELSVHYKNIQKKYPVHIGKEFWHRLTGDENFYVSLTNAIGEVASEYDGSQMIEDVITTLAKQIEKMVEE